MVESEHLVIPEEKQVGVASQSTDHPVELSPIETLIKKSFTEGVAADTGTTAEITEVDDSFQNSKDEVVILSKKIPDSVRRFLEEEFRARFEGIRSIKKEDLL